MKNLLIYIFCFFSLLACNKEESVRLQKEETIITGTVTEQQRGIVIEGATVYLLEYLYPGNDDKCGTCQKIIDSTLTDVNGNFEFRFNAKQGTNWNYKTWCEKQNYITKIASRFNDIVKAQSNTANLALYATGTFNLVAIQSIADTNFYISSFGLITLGSDNQQVLFTPANYPRKAVLTTKRIEAGINYTLDFRINKITNFQTMTPILFSKKLIDYYLKPEKNITDTLYF